MRFDLGIVDGELFVFCRKCRIAMNDADSYVVHPLLTDTECQYLGQAFRSPISNIEAEHD